MALRFALLLACGGLVAGLAHPVSAADFYAGRQIKLVVGGGVGGGTDLYGRFLARHLGAHIPGRPGIVVVNMPGADSISAGNYFATSAPRDGTEMLAIAQSLPMVQALGNDNIRFDLARFGWIGNMSQSVNVFIAWHASGVRTLEDAKHLPLTIGSTTAGSLSGIMPVVLNNLLGTRFRIVNGYESGGTIELAMERGEVGGRASVTWASLKGEHPDWVRERKIAVLVQVGLARDPELPQVPLLSDLVPEPPGRAVAGFLGDMAGVARAYALGPGVPEERLAILRRAFDAAMRDPALLEEAARLQLDVSPTPGAELQDIVASIVRASPEVVAQVTAAIR